MSKQKLPSLKISLSGVRGIVGESLTPQLVASFAAAFGSHCGAGEIVIGTDTRPSRQMVTQAALAGLLSVGCTPVDIGIVPVPILQFQVGRTGAVGGICVTASHNPVEWNALKFFGSTGLALRPTQFAELRDLYHQGVYPRVPSRGIPEIQQDHDSAIAAHRETVLQSLDLSRITARNFKVAIDCCNGAASRVAPEFLRTLGCDVVMLNCDPDEPFPRHPEPTRAHLGPLREIVQHSGADVGFALDADADRLALVDEEGVALGEDATVTLVVRHVLSRQPGAVVVSQSTSRMVDDVAGEFGCPVYRSKVGEINVIEEIFRRQAVVGGEGNGGVIVPAVNPCRDSFVGMGSILELLTREESALSTMRRKLPRYTIIKQKLSCRPRDVQASLRLLRRLFRDLDPDLSDGIKVTWPDRWLHVRGSNTEPVIRLVAEARQEEQANELINRTLDYLRPIVDPESAED